MFNFDNPPDRRGSDSIKWARYASTPAGGIGDVIPMWVADADFAAPPPVIDALRRRIDHGVFGYAAAPSDLKNIIADWTARRYGWQIDPQWIAYVPGVMTGMSAALRALTQVGDKVVTTVPVYPPFLRMPLHLERCRIDVPMIEPAAFHDARDPNIANPAGDGPGDSRSGDTGGVVDGGANRRRWQLDLPALEAAIGDGAKALMWCNPHNPCGRIFSADEQRAVAEICLRSDTIICSDEIHCDLLLQRGARHVPIASLSPQIAARTLTFMAPSKSFNIPGLSFSFAVIPDTDLRRQFRRAMQEVVPWPNILGYIAARAAYAQGDAWLDALLDYLRGNRDLLAAAIADLPPSAAGQGQPLVQMSPVEATYLAWLDVRALHLDEPQEHFERHGLGIMDGADFGLEGFVRLNFACSRNLLREALRRLKSAVCAAVDC